MSANPSPNFHPAHPLLENENVNPDSVEPAMLAFPIPANSLALNAEIRNAQARHRRSRIVRYFWFIFWAVLLASMLVIAGILISKELKKKNHKQGADRNGIEELSSIKPKMQMNLYLKPTPTVHDDEEWEKVLSRATRTQTDMQSINQIQNDIYDGSSLLPTLEPRKGISKKINDDNPASIK